jgi:hypothetical protein
VSGAQEDPSREGVPAEGSEANPEANLEGNVEEPVTDPP